MTTPAGNREPTRLDGDELAELGCRADAACQELAATLANGELTLPPGAATRILGVLADHGLLQLDSFRADSSSVTPADLRRIAAVAGTLASHSGTAASVYMVHVLCGTLIALAGNPRQKAELLPGLCRGELGFAFAMTEPQAGSDAAGLTTSARQHPDGYILVGEKIYTTGAATADWIIVVARAQHHAHDKRKLSLFLVPGDAPGLELEPLGKIAGDGHPSCRVGLDGVIVPPAQVLAGEGRLGTAWATLRTTGLMERTTVAAMALGTARAATRRATEVARAREQFGRKIASFQSIEHTLVDMHVTLSAMDLMVDNALGAVERDGEDPTMAVAMAKCYCAEQLQLILAKGMRVVGGRGYFHSEPMARLYREAPFSLYAGGTIEIQKMLISRALGLCS